MNQLDLASYQKTNYSFQRKMVYHVGGDCGFFVEMNYMVNAMLYCLEHRVRFQLYSEDANFGTGVGWSEYFLPLCEEVHEGFHRRYNFHRPPSWRRIIQQCWGKKTIAPIKWKLKCIMKTVMGHLMAIAAYREFVLLNQDVPTFPSPYYCFHELGIRGGYYEIYGLLARMIWRLHPEVLCQVELSRRKLDLPLVYDGIHIRGGDKDSETELIDGKSIMQTMKPNGNSCVFVLTDDYRHMLSLRTEYPALKFESLCQPQECGYRHAEFCKQPSKERRRAIVRLLVSMDFLLNSCSFVGSITTGPSVFVMKLRAGQTSVLAVDCSQEELPFALTQTIDVRAEISKRNMKYRL